MKISKCLQNMIILSLNNKCFSLYFNFISNILFIDFLISSRDKILFANKSERKNVEF